MIKILQKYYSSTCLKYPNIFLLLHVRKKTNNLLHNSSLTNRNRKSNQNLLNFLPNQKKQKNEQI